MTRKELVESVTQTVAASLEVEVGRREVAEIIDAAFDRIGEAIRSEGRYAHPGFGTFKLQRRGPRPGLNPQTGESILTRASATVGFTPAARFKQTLG